MGTKGQPLGKRFLDVQAESVKKYGKIFRAQIPGVNIVVISDPADVAELLRSEPKYPQRLKFPILDYYREKRKKNPFFSITRARFKILS